MTIFKDRQEAGKHLAQALAVYAGTDAIVYALPRGGAVLGHEVATALHIPLDLIITRKVGHPRNPEYAVCAITEEGSMVCNESERMLLDPLWLKNETKREQKEATRRRHVYLRGRERHPASRKTAIVVDDGVATGLTIRAAIESLRKDVPKKLVVSVPLFPKVQHRVERRRCIR